MPARGRQLDFTQWQNDLIVYEVATLIRRRSATNELMLNVIGAALSPIVKDILASQKCSIKRFITDAEDDFRMGGTTHAPVAIFIGDKSRYELPVGLPEEHLAEYRALENPMERQQVVDEILRILTRKRNARSWVPVTHIISRLSDASRGWLRDRRWKVTIFVADTPAFEISIPRVGKAKVRVRAPSATEKADSRHQSPACAELTRSDSEKAHSRDESPACAELTRSCLRSASTVSTDASPASSRGSSSSSGFNSAAPICALRHLIATMGAQELAEMLNQNRPEFYED